MLKLEFLLPAIYGFVVSLLIIKCGLIDLEMNTITWGVYFVNLFIAFLLSKLGRRIDKCLGL